MVNEALTLILAKNVCQNVATSAHEMREDMCAIISEEREVRTEELNKANDCAQIRELLTTKIQITQEHCEDAITKTKRAHTCSDQTLLITTLRSMEIRRKISQNTAILRTVNQSSSLQNLPKFS